uniref:Uncharacterized protein n=1 Tax=Schistocephalus solidus TaxID=70667 RepID=A0A183SCF1_SCHSO
LVLWPLPLTSRCGPNSLLQSTALAIHLQVFSLEHEVAADPTLTSGFSTRVPQSMR